MLERLKEYWHRLSTGSSSDRHASQREVDEHRRQLIIFGVSVTALLLVIVLAVGAVYQYVYLPGQTVASVNGEEISKNEYWKYRKYELLSQLNQFQQMAQFSEGEQGQQYQQMAQQTAQDFRNVENDPVDPMTVNTMVENDLLVQSLDDFDLEITEEEVDRFLVTYFTGEEINEDGEFSDEESELRIDPTAAAWATATAEAQQQEAEEAREQAEEDAAEAEEPAEDSEESGDDAQAGEDVEEEPTLEPEEIYASATAVAEQHEENFLNEADMSEDDFVELYIKPIMAREKIRSTVGEDAPLRAEQVHASHILVATQEAANVIHEELEDGADFEELAEQQSVDQQTAPNGGDLGWFPRGLMVDAFENAAFETEPGEYSEPVQTEFGWHIIYVHEFEEDRPVELQTLQTIRQREFSEWLEEKRASAEIDAPETEADPAQPGLQPGAQPGGQFSPPPGAPQPPAPEMPDVPEDMETPDGANDSDEPEETDSSEEDEEETEP